MAGCGCNFNSRRAASSVAKTCCLNLMLLNLFCFFLRTDSCWKGFIALYCSCSVILPTGASKAVRTLIAISLDCHFKWLFMNGINENMDVSFILTDRQGLFGLF